MQPEALHEAGEWLSRAQRDLRVARKMLDGDEIFPEAAGFHAQQAVEKSAPMKARRQS